MRDAQPLPGVLWVGPFRLRDYVERCVDPNAALPPEAPGVYVVSRNAWQQQPSTASEPLYVGGNPRRADFFRIRVGLLILNILGYTTNVRFEHAGGRKVCEWRRENGVHPLDLYLGWLAGIECVRCFEDSWHARINPRFGRRPGRCPRLCKV